MKVYVAGKWEEKERVREVQRQLISAGHTISFDWTQVCDGTEEHMKVQAANDKQGVLDADAFVGVFEKDLRYSGALTEMGMAMANGAKIYILGNAVDTNLFMRLPEVRRGIDELL
jgi:hypothetical protein